MCIRGCQYLCQGVMYRDDSVCGGCMCRGGTTCTFGCTCKVCGP